MGTKPRIKPERLADKLRQIRLALGLSQAEMWRHLGVQDLIAFKQISTYELGKREPPLTILLQYARAANVSTDVLIDDDLNLPASLPSKPKHARKG
ncbi:MAG TPA: helix-turn-helix transcriptional regulator [Nitrososphaera sp.]|jgi:transcriptional regulator with XRE-family HTH domain|nr:helix-turn-helix transcriptional regulator [Nitrososphaera sp.]